jgi:site-specific DNA-methyltransferase (adenine-specific)
MPKRNHADSLAAPDNRPDPDSQVDDWGTNACPAVEMIHGDCRDVMPILPAGAFDGCVCDPPYGQGIAEWDLDVPAVDVWRAVLRLMKPGAVLAAFGGRARYDVLAARVREAGFLVKGQAVWIFRGGRAQSRNHLLPAHELILLARAPGDPIPLNVDAVRTPWANEEDRKKVSRIDSLRETGRRRPVYNNSLDNHGRKPFVANKLGRYPTTVMATDDVLGEPGHVFIVPKVRNARAHLCAKPLKLMVRLVNAFVPPEGVVLDPFAGSGTVGVAAKLTGRKAVLIELAKAA